MSSDSKLCRTCLGEGSRHIFQPSVYNDKWCTAASINFLAEKLRCVAMLPVNEDDGFPVWICELCLVQLNLAYKFKLLAVETARKLPLLDGGRRPTRTTAITYDGADSHDTIDIGPTMKQEPLADGSDCPDNSAEDNFPRIVSAVSYAKACWNDPASCVLPTPPGMVMLKTVPADPAEDAVFVQSFLKTPNSDNASDGSPATSAQLQAKASKQTNHRRRRQLSTRKRSTKRRCPEPLAQENKPDNAQQQVSDTSDERSFTPSRAKDHKPVCERAKRAEKMNNLDNAQEQSSDTSDERSFTPSRAKDHIPVSERAKHAEKMNKLMRSLDIDMVVKTPARGKHGVVECSWENEFADLPIAEKVKLRRNSICVPLYMTT